MDVKKPNTQAANRTAQAEVNAKKTDKSTTGKTFAIIVALLVLVGLGAFAAWTYSKDLNSSVAADVQTDKFQAVFLTNGQVYFGKLSNVEGKYIKLDNIYYLQVQQSVQPSTSSPEVSQNDGSQVSLTKLGKELHGPTDEMFISQNEVLFWENLTKDSTVVKAITDYEKNDK